MLLQRSDADIEVFGDAPESVRDAVLRAVLHIVPGDLDIFLDAPCTISVLITPRRARKAHGIVYVGEGENGDMPSESGRD